VQGLLSSIIYHLSPWEGCLLLFFWGSKPGRMRGPVESKTGRAISGERLALRGRETTGITGKSGGGACQNN
jgi:hypothetical protein